MSHGTRLNVAQIEISQYNGKETWYPPGAGSEFDGKNRLRRAALGSCRGPLATRSGAAGPHPAIMNISRLVATPGLPCVVLQLRLGTGHARPSSARLEPCCTCARSTQTRCGTQHQRNFHLRPRTGPLRSLSRRPRTVLVRPGNHPNFTFVTDHRMAPFIPQYCEANSHVHQSH